MKNLLFLSSFILLCALANASKPLVSSFVTHLTTSLSFLSHEDIDDEFDVHEISTAQSRQLSNDYDRYYVLLKDKYTVLNFTKQLITVTHKPGFKDTEFIGGQNKSLIVICKELFLLSDPFKIMIHSYARVPDLARISPSVIAALSKASNNHSAVSLTVASASGTYKTFDLTFAGSQDKEENNIAPAIITKSLKALKTAGSLQQKVSAQRMVKSSLVQPLSPLSTLIAQKGFDRIELTPKWQYHSHLRQLNDYARQTIADGEYIDNENIKFYKTHNLNGRNVVVGVGDSGVDLKKQQVDQEVIVKSSCMYLSLEMTKLKLMVMGLICAEQLLGVAPEARIVLIDLQEGDGNMQMYTDIYNKYYKQYVYNNNVRILSNSWGSSSYTYDSVCSLTDKFVWDYKDMVILFSAGNSGDEGFGTVVSPGLSKNVITVGATLTERIENGMHFTIYFSSKGDPERRIIKPDIVAPGIQRSAKSLSSEDCGSNCNDHDGVCEIQGATTANAVASGAVALITQYLTEKSYHNRNIEKQASLIKAMLVHSGQPTLGYCEQDLSCYTYGSNHLYYEGHGRIQLDRVLHYAGESDFELFLYNGQVNYEKEYFSLEFTITDISFKK
ncbi:uncharacterized protein [Blastocystis hominis]|uniref:subtilisin n=1 Tax=Blastocystis hominis TaxID=12968 RepID=D8M4R4_BLAHO|nr:uncharacterized protein [Blastocystis hominis]CBK23053.2 unnamed protein product [Blastocystis hominis]|eukprot:XP_012897101.1 uncharacterized protein [Blastocystis hominis]